MPPASSHPVLRLLGRDRTAVYPWFVAVGLVLAWAVSVGLGTGWVDVAGNVVGSDFLAFWAGARMVAEDPTAPVYDPLAMNAYQHALLPALPPDTGLPFLNPPVALLWFAPFAPLDYGVALGLWWTLGIVAWVLGHRLLGEALALSAWRPSQLVVASVLFPPTLQWFFFGQATPLLFLLLAASFALLVRGRELGAGAVLGLLAFKPQVALGLALPLIVARRWLALLGGVLSVGAQLTLSALWWPEVWTRFFEARSFIAGVLIDPGYKTWGVQSLYAFWHLLVGGVSPGAANALTAASSVVLVGWLVAVWAREPWDPSSRRWQLAVAATQIVALTLGMQAFLYDLALLLVPFWIAVAAVDARPKADPALDGGPVLLASATLWVVCFVGPYLTAAMSAATAPTGVRFAVQLPVIALVGAAVWLMQRRATLGPPP